LLLARPALIAAKEFLDNGAVLRLHAMERASSENNVFAGNVG